MNTRTAIRRMLALALCFASASAFALENFTETFDSDVAFWRNTPGTLNLTWFSDGGPGGDGDAYASETNFSFYGRTVGDYPLFARGNMTYGTNGASSGAFIGNWTAAGVYMVSADVRHNADVPLRFGIRTSGPMGRGTAVIFDAYLPPNTWGRVVLPIDRNRVGWDTLSYEAGTFDLNYQLVQNVQLMVIVPEGHSSDTNAYKLDVDNVSIRLSGTTELWDDLAMSAPTYDRWMYQFNMAGPPGDRPDAGTFMTDDNRFDYRDAQAYFGFVLTNEIPAGLGAENYEVLSCRVKITMGGGEAIYDPTSDGWETYLNPETDGDGGRPMELFGAGWRGTNTAWTFGENGDYPTPPPFTWGDTTPYIWKNIRNVYALGYKDGVAVDVSNSVDPDNTGTNGFDPVVFAIGTADLNPGDDVPLGTTFTFDIETANTNIQAYLADSLNDGILGLVLAPLYMSALTNQTGYPIWDNKETLEGTPASLEMTYRVAGGGPRIEGVTDEGDVRVVRWSRTAEHALLEATTNLYTAATNWQPVIMQITTNDAYVETVLSTRAGTNENGHAWFFRLRQP